MARPIKATVEYFSHDADAGESKTLSILFNHFQHEGISAWWLLLEQVSKTRNHVIFINNPEDLEFLAAKMHFKPDRLLEILAKIADLGAIDKELFDAGYIWCQNLVDRLEVVYRTRKQDLPSKPRFLLEETELIGEETELIGEETLQSKVKERKGKETFVETSEPFRLAEHLLKHISSNNPKYKTPNLQSWARHVDLMIRVDGRDIDDIRAVIDWCQSDSFWKSNILSTDKLRKQYDALYAKMIHSNSYESHEGGVPHGSTRTTEYY